MNPKQRLIGTVLTLMATASVSMAAALPAPGESSIEASPRPGLKPEFQPGGYLEALAHLVETEEERARRVTKLTQAAAEVLKQKVSLYDVNGDGVLTPEEVNSSPQMQMELAVRRAEMKLQREDYNKDGVVDEQDAILARAFSESNRVARVLQLKVGRMEQIVGRDAMLKHDTNGDGTIGLDEIGPIEWAVGAYLARRREELLRQYDLNANRLFDDSEVAQLEADQLAGKMSLEPFSKYEFKSSIQAVPPDIP